MRDKLIRASAVALKELLEALPPPRRCAGTFSTETFIAGLASEPADPGCLKTLEALAKKVEVGRILRLAYSYDLAKPASELEVEPPYAEALAAAFVHFGIAQQDWKWINTALKMEWGILREPPFEMPKPVGEILKAVLEEAA